MTILLRICLVFLFLLSASGLFGQHVRTIPANKITYKNILCDSSERAMFVTPTVDQNFLVVGLSNQRDIMGDVFIRKVDKSLRVLHEKNLGVPGFDMAFSGLITSDNFLVLAGFTTYKSKGGIDAYLIKATLDGDTLWTHRVGDIGDDRIIRVIETRDKGYLAVGQTTSWGNGSIDGLLLKFDRAGGVLWKTTIGDAVLDRAYSVAQTIDGDFIVSGITNANYPDNSDIVLARVDSNGNLVWKKKMGGQHGDISHSMIAKDKKTFVSIGYTAENSSPLSDPLIVHFDEHGTILGNYTIQTGFEIRLMDGYFTGADKLLCTGYMRDTASHPWDITVVEFNFKAKKFSISRLSLGTHNDEAFHITRFDKNNALIVGHTQNGTPGKSNMMMVQWPLVK